MRSTKIIILTVAFGIAFLLSAASHAGAGVTVKRIDEATLDSLMQAKDNRMMVSFMAAWCGPCVDELPVLNKLYQQYVSRGLRLIGISIDLEGPEAMQPIVNGLEIDFPVYWYGEKAVAKFQLTAIPVLVFIRQGQVVERIYGRRSREFLEKKIRLFFDGSINDLQQDCSPHCQQQTADIKTGKTPETNRRSDKSPRIFAGHNKFGNNPDDQSQDNPGQNSHIKPPFGLAQQRKQ